MYDDYELAGGCLVVFLYAAVILGLIALKVWIVVLVVKALLKYLGS